MSAPTPFIQPNIAIRYQAAHKDRAQRIAQQLGYPLTQADDKAFDFILEVAEAISLIHCHHQHKPIKIDFCAGKNFHRYRYGGGKSQAIAKACGLKSLKNPRILDATGGFGSDAFALATLGCHVTVLERNPVIGLLLEDGLDRAKKNMNIKKLDINLVKDDASRYLQSGLPHQFEVIYLDPMFPHRSKSSLVKKEMQILQQLVGPDNDSENLLALAIEQAIKRVVVKRPASAPPLTPRTPDFCYRGRSSRFDIYLTKSAP